MMLMLRFPGRSAGGVGRPRKGTFEAEAGAVPAIRGMRYGRGLLGSAVAVAEGVVRVNRRPAGGAATAGAGSGSVVAAGAGAGVGVSSCAADESSASIAAEGKRRAWMESRRLFSPTRRSLACEACCARDVSTTRASSL
eukprot:3755059-Pleurochrysis_carterae.AAC.3